MTEIRTVTVERDFPFAPDKVWRALTQPHLIAEWIMKNDFRAEAGQPFTLTGDWGSVQGKVLTVEPFRSLSYRWDHANADAAFDLKSVVTFTLTPTPAGTHLRMEQTGFRPDQKQALGGAAYGWNGHFDRLEQVLARLD